MHVLTAPLNVQWNAVEATDGVISRFYSWTYARQTDQFSLKGEPVTAVQSYKNLGSILDNQVKQGNQRLSF